MKAIHTIHIQYHKTPFGELIIGAFKDQLCLCDWRYRRMRETVDQRIQKGLNAIYKKETTPIIEQTKMQLTDYFSGHQTLFSVPLLFVGSDFQKKVWNSLLTINYGVTSTYLKLSEQIGNKSAIRAVASANGANAISILVPCHRIIGSNGELVGYAGGLAAKKGLLKLENPEFDRSIATQMSLAL
jgi:methylated-DNA-[protein]-cysteine S-methyltransferase